MPDTFYVGYLTLPRGYRRFLTVVVMLLMTCAIAVSYLVSSRQNSPGSGTWDLGKAVTLTGVLRHDPYTMLTVTDDRQAVTRHVLLVTMGKIGGHGLGLPQEGETVTVTGYPIARSAGPMLLTIESGSTAVQEPQHEDGQWTRFPIGRVTLDGQIIDPKCYFGAMKPGEGKVHKACATLCIRGGIPPMFMVTHADGVRTYYLLLDKDGGGITGPQLDRLLPYVADPVRITGRAERVGDLLTLRIDTARIDRL